MKKWENEMQSHLVVRTKLVYPKIITPYQFVSQRSVGNGIGTTRLLFLVYAACRYKLDPSSSSSCIILSNIDST